MPELSEGNVIAISSGDNVYVIDIETIKDKSTATNEDEEGTWSIELCGNALETERAQVVYEALTVPAVTMPITPDYAELSSLMEEYTDIVSCLSIRTVTFTPESGSGEISLEYPVNTIYNEDTDMVVYEFLFKDDMLVAEHSDIDDEGQTVAIVNSTIGTTATDKSDGDHYLLPSREAVIVDEVAYERN